MSPSLRVLFIEDSDDDALLLQRALQRGGYDLTVERVDTAAAMISALDRQPWDIVISDYNLPQFSGLAALELLKEKQVDLPFIIVSGAIGEKVAVQAMKAGAHDYVMKDNLARLVPAIERELRDAAVRQERRQAAEDLRASEEKFNKAFRSSPVAMLISRISDARHIDANEAFFKMTGYNEHEVVDRSSFELNIWAKTEEQARVQDEIQRHGYVKEIEISIRRKSGASGVGLVSAETIDLNGEPCILFSIYDIAARKQTEEQIHRRNRELALLNSIIAASVTSLEPEEILETACRELSKVFELPQVVATMLNREKTTFRIVAEYITEGAPSLLHQSRSATKDPSFQYILTHQAPLVVDDTSTNPHLVSVQSQMHEQGVMSMILLPLIIQGQVIGGLGLSDLNPRAFSNQEISLAWSVADQVASALGRIRLDKERRQMSAALEQIAESVIITDTQSTILYVNPAFERASGYSRAEVVGLTPSILNSGKQVAAFYQELWTTISAGQVWQGRFINRKKDGSHYIEDATVTPVRNESGEIGNYVSVQRDITHELKLEEQYRQAQKMEAVGRLAAGIAHDFNNLLTAINGFAILIQNELPSTDPRQELVDKILYSGGRAAELVRQLLAFSRKQAVKPQVLNLNMVVANLDKLLQRIIGEHIELETVLTPELWSVKADPAQLEQIIVNLAVNGSDAMPDGGRLTIETANVIVDQDYAAEHLEAQPGEHVLLCVSDTGIGMAEELISHIFEPFFTTKEVGKGTGLGLATVFGLVKQSNGHIWVYSEPDHGSVFKIYLPRVTPAVPSSFVPPLTPSLSRGMETVLLVEDETMVRELAARVLRQQGYTVLEATDGKEALRLAQSYKDEIYLLLTDVIMPQMNGETLAEKIVAMRPSIKVLFASGYTLNSIMRRGLLEQGVLFIQKPFTPLDLTHKAREVLDDSQRE